MTPAGPTTSDTTGSSDGLTPLQARRFAVLRAVLVFSMVGSALTFVAGVTLLFVPSASALWRAIAWGVFIEMATSTAVLGAFARCPACRTRLSGGQTQGLFPERCPGCGVRLAAESRKAAG